MWSNEATHRKGKHLLSRIVAMLTKLTRPQLDP
jgi:hypothetical protein